MTQADANPPAFPNDYRTRPDSDYADEGMSLRDYFAAAALPSIVSATSAGQHEPKMRDGEVTILAAMARDAYDLADAMLKARQS